MEKQAAESAGESQSRHRFRELMPWNWGYHNGEEAGVEPFDSLQQAMNQLLGAFRREAGSLGKGDRGMVSSRMDVAETDDAFEVTIELPGMDENDIDVSVTRDTLTVRGEKKTETSEKKKDYHYRECRYGSVERVVPVPQGVDVDQVAAKFRNGVLSVTLPKTAETRRQARKVEVQAPTQH